MLLPSTVMNSLKFFRVGGLNKWVLTNRSLLLNFILMQGRKICFLYWWNSYIEDNFFHFRTSANLPECSSRSEKVSMWKFGSSSRKSPVTVPSSHFEAILWMKFQKSRPRAWAESSCNWLIMLVTMATPRSSHVKVNNSIFTACDEDMIF